MGAQTVELRSPKNLSTSMSTSRWQDTLESTPFQSILLSPSSKQPSCLVDEKTNLLHIIKNKTSDATQIHKHLPHSWESDTNIPIKSSDLITTNDFKCGLHGTPNASCDQDILSKTLKSRGKRSRKELWTAPLRKEHLHQCCKNDSSILVNDKKTSLLEEEEEINKSNDHDKKKGITLPIKNTIIWNNNVVHRAGRTLPWDDIETCDTSSLTGTKSGCMNESNQIIHSTWDTLLDSPSEHINEGNSCLTMRNCRIGLPIDYWRPCVIESALESIHSQEFCKEHSGELLRDNKRFKSETGLYNGDVRQLFSHKHTLSLPLSLLLSPQESNNDCLLEPHESLLSVSPPPDTLNSLEESMRRLLLLRSTQHDEPHIMSHQKETNLPHGTDQSLSEKSVEHCDISDHIDSTIYPQSHNSNVIDRELTDWYAGTSPKCKLNEVTNSPYLTPIHHKIHTDSIELELQARLNPDTFKLNYYQESQLNIIQPSDNLQSQSLHTQQTTHTLLNEPLQFNESMLSDTTLDTFKSHHDSQLKKNLQTTPIRLYSSIPRISSPKHKTHSMSQYYQVTDKNMYQHHITTPYSSLLLSRSSQIPCITHKCDQSHTCSFCQLQQQHPYILSSSSPVTSSATSSGSSSEHKYNGTGINHFVPPLYRLTRSPTARAAIVHYPYPPVPAQYLPQLKHSHQQALFDEFIKIESDPLRVQLGHFIVEHCTRSIPEEYLRSELAPDPRVITDFVDQIILAVEIFGEQAQYGTSRDCIPTDINEVYISKWLQQKKHLLKPLEVLHRRRQKQKLFSLTDNSLSTTVTLPLPDVKRTRKKLMKYYSTHHSSIDRPFNTTLDSIHYDPVSSDYTDPCQQETPSYCSHTVLQPSSEMPLTDSTIPSSINVKITESNKLNKIRNNKRSHLHSRHQQKAPRRIGVSLGEELDSLGVPRIIHYENLRYAIENRGLVVQLPSNNNSQINGPTHLHELQLNTASSHTTHPYFNNESTRFTGTNNHTTRSQVPKRSLFNLLIAGRGDTRRSRLELPWGDTVKIKYNRTLLGIPDFVVEGLGYGTCNGGGGGSHHLIPKVCAVSLEDSLYGVEVLLFYRGLPCNKRVPRKFIHGVPQCVSTHQRRHLPSGSSIGTLGGSTSSHTPYYALSSMSVLNNAGSHSTQDLPSASSYVSQFNVNGHALSNVHMGQETDWNRPVCTTGMTDELCSSHHYIEQNQIRQTHETFKECSLKKTCHHDNHSTTENDIYCKKQHMDILTSISETTHDMTGQLSQKHTHELNKNASYYVSSSSERINKLHTEIDTPIHSSSQFYDVSDGTIKTTSEVYNHKNLLHINSDIKEIESTPQETLSHDPLFKSHQPSSDTFLQHEQDHILLGSLSKYRQTTLPTQLSDLSTSPQHINNSFHPLDALFLDQKKIVESQTLLNHNKSDTLHEHWDNEDYQSLQTAQHFDHIPSLFSSHQHNQMITEQFYDPYVALSDDLSCHPIQEKEEAEEEEEEQQQQELPSLLLSSYNTSNQIKHHIIDTPIIHSIETRKEPLSTQPTCHHILSDTIVPNETNDPKLLLHHETDTLHNPFKQQFDVCDISHASNKSHLHSKLNDPTTLDCPLLIHSSFPHSNLKLNQSFSHCIPLTSLTNLEQDTIKNEQSIENNFHSDYKQSFIHPDVFQTQDQLLTEQAYNGTSSLQAKQESHMNSIEANTQQDTLLQTTIGWECSTIPLLETQQHSTIPVIEHTYVCNPSDTTSKDIHELQKTKQPNRTRLIVSCCINDKEQSSFPNPFLSHTTHCPTNESGHLQTELSHNHTVINHTMNVSNMFPLISHNNTLQYSHHHDELRCVPKHLSEPSVSVSPNLSTTKPLLSPYDQPLHKESEPQWFQAQANHHTYNCTENS